MKAYRQFRAVAAAGCSIAAILAANPLAAQDTAQDEEQASDAETSPEVIVVRGVRGSIARSVDLKKLQHKFYRSLNPVGFHGR